MKAYAFHPYVIHTDTLIVENPDIQEKVLIYGGAQSQWLVFQV